MNEFAAVRTGLPLRAMLLRILLPVAVLLLLSVTVVSVWMQSRIRDDAWSSLEATVRTVFDSHAAVRGTGGGLAVLASKSGLERIWVVDATGRILDAALPGEAGRMLDPVWWEPVRGMSDSRLVEQLPYGRSEVVLIALRDATVGRYVVAVGPVPEPGLAAVSVIGSILGVSLMLWLVVAASVWILLTRNLQQPLAELDDRSLSIIRGDPITDAALDRTEALAVPLLGGHAACTADLARYALAQRGLGRERAARFEALFDAVPARAVIIRRDGAVLAANRRIRALRPDASSLVDLAAILPTGRVRAWLDRVGDAGTGLEDVALPDGTQLTLQPIRWEDRAAVLVMVTDETDGASVGEDVPYRALFEATGTHAIVFDEDARIVHATPGLVTTDLRRFRDENLASDADRDAFDAWMHERPDLRPQILDTVLTGREAARLVWHATEVREDGREAGLLWAHPSEAAGEPETA